MGYLTKNVISLGRSERKSMVAASTANRQSGGTRSCSSMAMTRTFLVQVQFWKPLFRSLDIDFPLT
jgi:hypothetical protein